MRILLRTFTNDVFTALPLLMSVVNRCVPLLVRRTVPPSKAVCGVGSSKGTRALCMNVSCGVGETTSARTYSDKHDAEKTTRGMKDANMMLAS